MIQDAGRIVTTVTTHHALNYLISVPDDYDPEGEPLPLLVFLHGAGERSQDMETIKRWGPPQMIAQGHQFDAIVVSPQCLPGSWWEPHVPAVHALLDQLEQTYRIDTDREYLTGLSMGAYSAFTLAAARPDRFAALVAISGGGSRTEARELAKTPVWLFHGDADPIIEVSESLRMARLLHVGQRETARLTIYPGVDHNAWTRTYDDPKVWDWLFSHRRGRGAAVETKN